MKQVTAYKCEFCHRCFGRQCNAVQHETWCKHNPVMRHCRTCVHSGLTVLDTIEIGDGKEVEITAPACHYHGKLICDKPYEIECETTGDPFPERPTPGTCWHYIYKGCSGWTKQKEGD